MSVNTSPSAVLREVAIAAVLGTDRTGPSPNAPGALLARAAVAQARARAGRSPGSGASDVRPCPPQTRIAATPSQAAFIERSLMDFEFNMIDEWAQLAEIKGVRIPDALVPAVLEWWCTQSNRSPAVMRATGSTGPWLASFNPRWRKPTDGGEIPEGIEDIWLNGTSSERYALLRTVVSANPTRAIGLIATTWNVDGADERRRFIETLARNVVAAYEPFLESALDDRSKTVRREAARVLAMIPGSALRTRMNQRVAPMLIVERSKTLLRKEKITLSVEPPKEFDPAWERDGLEQQAGAGTGKRAHWMRQILGAADLSTWTSRCGLGPADLIASLQADDYWQSIYYAMVESLAACPAQPDAMKWCTALIPVTPGGNTPDFTPIARVWRALPLEQSEQLRLEFAPIVRNHLAMWTIATTDDRPWSEGYSFNVLALLRQITPIQADASDLRPWIDEVAKQVHPTAIDGFDAMNQQIYPDGLTPRIQKSLDRARARAEMHKEFNA